MATGFRWGRIVLAAVLLEVAITAVVLPIGAIYGNPLDLRPGAPANTTPYFVAAAVGCAGLGFIFGVFGAAKAHSRIALHGLLVGIVATALYLGVCSLAPGGLTAVLTAYSPRLYVLFNVLRILGSWSGGIHRASTYARRTPSRAPRPPGLREGRGRAGPW